MTLRQLYYFLRIVDIGSLSRAAQSLHVAQPALSQQIIRLEEELGVKLLLRSVRGVTPTSAGMAVYRHAQTILKQVDATRLIAHEADAGPGGTVTVGLPWTVSTPLGLPLLRRVRESLPAVRLEIVGGPSPVLANLLAEGKLEFTVLFDDHASSGLELRPVLNEPLYFIGPRHSLGRKRQMSIQEVAARPLLLLSRPNSIRERIEASLARAGLRADVAGEINAADLLVAAVKAGLGYSIVSACGLGTSESRYELDAALLEDETLRRDVHLGTSRLHPMSLAAERVYAILLDLMELAVKQGSWKARLATPVGDDAATPI